MADNRKVENDEPAQEQQYQPTLELRKQLEDGPKYVQLQGEGRTYAMTLSVNVIQEPDADDVMRIPPAIPRPDGDGAMQGAVGEEVRQEPGGTYDALGPDGKREFESDCIYVQRALGHGGFGIVYRAEFRRGEQTDRLCLKMGLHKRKYKSEDERVRGQQEVNKSILREARHYRELSDYPHDNIVSMQFYCTSQDYNEVFLALDYCQGITLSYLANRYRDKNLPTVLYKIMLESTLAVQHCISHGIVHCDIKPSNIIFAGMDRPLKLIDFGCAVNLDDGIDPRRDIAGTFEYMAPEILLHGLRSLGKKSDVYSLGALFFKVVTRRTPWFHNEEIRIVRGDRERRAEVKDIIAEEFCKFSKEQSEELKQTAIQSILTDGISAHFSCIPEQCNLICRMLSFHHSDRPSCEEILEDMTTTRKKKVKPVAPDGCSETDESHIPATVFSFNTTTSKGAQAATSTVSVEYMDIPSGDLLSGRGYNSSFYGPSSKESLINEELRVDYAGAMADEVDEQHVELRRLFHMLVQTSQHLNVSKELRAMTVGVLQQEQELRAATEGLLQQEQELRAATEGLLQKKQELGAATERVLQKEQDVDDDTSFSWSFDVEPRGEQESRRELSNVEEQGYCDPSLTSVGDVMVGPLTQNTTSSFTTTGNIQSTSTAPGDIHSTSTASGDIQSASTSDGNNQSTSTSDELRVDYAGAMADEVDVQQVELIRLQEDSDLVDVEQAEEIYVSSPYIPGLPTVLDDISLSSDELNVSEEHYADFSTVMQSRSLSLPENLHELTWNDMQANIDTEIARSLPLPTDGIRDSLAQDVETAAENLDELSFDERQTNIDTEIESILNEVDAGHYVIMSHPDDDKNIYILGIHVERAIAEFEALTSKPEFLQYSIMPSNVEEFHNGLPQYIKHLMPFTLEKHVLVGGTPEKIMNPSMPMCQLIVTASHVNNIPRTNGMHDPPLLPGFYGITVAHGFLIEWQTKRLFDSEEKESSIREEMLEANWNTRWSLRAADRNEIVQMDRAPICKYRQFYENCNEFLQDVAIFEISSNQLNEYGFRARDEHFDEETLHVLRTNFGRFIVAGYFPITSQDDVRLLRGKRVIVASTDGTITKPPRQRTRCRVPPTKHLGLHLNFRTTSNNSLDEGCSGSMVYVVDKDGRHVYIAGMLVGYWKQFKQLSGVAIHQAVIIEPCLKELESGSYMKIRDIRPLKNILGDNRTAQELVGILQGSN